MSDTSQGQDYYELLQVHPRADDAALKAAYERLRELYDPARLSGAAQELIDLARGKRAAIERAYAVLADPELRAAYDRGRAANGVARPSPADAQDAAPLDYRPLPPAAGAERPRGFDVAPLAAPPPSRPATPVAVIVGVTLVLLVVATSVLIAGGGRPAQPAPPPTVSALDAFEADIEAARARAEAAPDDAQAWVAYGNLLYDSAQIVREQAPESALYQERLPRWLEAIAAYERALAIDPGNIGARADKGASACFYGAGVGDQSYIRRGIEDMRAAVAAAPDSPLALLNLGYCLVSAQPPEVDEALGHWRRVVEIEPSDSAFAQRARQLIEQYSQ